MTVTAVQVHGTGCLVARGVRGPVQIGNRLGVAAVVSVMLVLVVTEVRCAGLLLVPAVRRHGCPAELERQKGEQDDGEDSTHGQESSGYRVGLVASKATGLWGFTTSRRGRARRCGSLHGG